MKIEKKNHFVEDEITAILNGLRSYNLSRVERNYSPFMVVAKEEEEIIGGAQCDSTWDWMHIKLLWVKEDFSNKGIGRKLMMEIETEARERRCVGVHLDTFEFQALGFYEKLGYTVFGKIADNPIGHLRYFLNKKFDSTSA